MRTLKRNQQILYYANPIGTTEILDGDFHTGEYVVKYGTPVMAKMNIGAEGGMFGMEQYGTQPSNTRLLIPNTRDFPVTEQTIFWIGIPTTQDYNYIVQTISKTLNSLKITVKRVIK